MKYAIFFFSLILFSYNGYADSVMSSEENSSDMEKQESVDLQEESSLSEYSSTDMAAFRVEERPDGYAPIGIMGDHVHEQGEVMLSFQIMMMRIKYEMQEIYHRGSHEVTNIIKNMNEDMWTGMLGLMYGLTDRWTAMAMVPYSLYNVSGGEIHHGLRDMSLSVLYAPLKEDSYRMVLSLEVFFPTAGSGFDSYISGVMEVEGEEIHYSFKGPRSAYAFLPKLSTLFYLDKISLGFQAGFKYSLDEDHYFYWFKNVFEPTAHIWGAVCLSENFSVSLRGVYQGDNITVFAEKEASMLFKDSTHSILSYLGLNFIGTDFLEGHRLAFEAGLPVYQSSLVKRERSYMFHLGWQKAF